LARQEYTESDVSVRVQTDASSIFRQLSSGHKIVLLMITRLVETVEERSLVLLDEPEAHLHPPLLSALVRSLSTLLSDRNGVAVIATHSPVVLQEVPKRCVWKMRRSGFTTSVDRPDIETFGENVGILTREVFGLEVTQTGFHRMLQEAVGSQGTYETAVRQFDGQLGGEAQALVRAFVANPSPSLNGM
jgi:ABC-type sulfate/molybdate transport systems ATPase subunit